MQTMETHAPSYHNMSGLSYTELWNALHSVHHTFQSSNYNLSGSYQSDQPREVQPYSVLNSADAEFSGGSQWSGDSDVNGSITIGKRETTLVPSANNHHEMGSPSTAAKTTTKTLTGLQTFQPLMSSQNRLVMQTPQQIDRDWYSLEPRWVDPKLSGEYLKVADSDAADALLSMKRAALVPLNPTLVNSNPSLQLRTRDSQAMKGLVYDELTPFIEDKSGADHQSSRKASSVMRNAIGSDPGREMHEVKDVAHTKYWRHQDISRVYNSSSDGYATSAKTTNESSSDTEDFRASGYHSSDGYQTTGLINATHMSPYNKAGGNGTSESDRYFTRFSGGAHSSDFTSGRGSVNTQPSLGTQPFTSGRGSVNTQPSLGTQPYIATTPVQKAITGRTIEDALPVYNQQKQHQKTQPVTNQNHQCRICGKGCTRPSSLRTHIRCHYGDKPFLCQLCGKNFSQAANLTAHMRIHSGEKPFKCTVCSRSFSQSSSVKTHMRTHTGERPYSCNFCSKAFSDSSTLSNHRRTHTGEKPYQCLVCYRPFSQSGNLNRHMIIHHRRTKGQQANKVPVS